VNRRRHAENTDSSLGELSGERDDMGSVDHKFGSRSTSYQYDLESTVNKVPRLWRYSSHLMSGGTVSVIDV